MNFFYKLLCSAVAICLAAGSYAQNVGIGTTTPQSQLSVGPNSQFRVDNNGNLIRINNIVTSFPSSQGGGGQVLTNDGSGNLTWTTPATGASSTVFGSGSAGALNVPVGNTVDWSTLSSATFNSLDFTTINIAGTLIVPSGLVIKATGNVTISGTITVLPISVSYTANPGVTATPAEGYLGGVGLTYIQAAGLVRAPLQAGGSGKMVYTGNNGNNGGNGGGGLTIYAAGAVSVPVSGVIVANGANGINVQTAGTGIIGTGGGGGGIVVLASNVSIAIGGAIRANGGNGVDGFNGNGGTGEGGGGGGGGGIITLIAPVAPSVTGTLAVNGGSGGANVSGTTLIGPGGGGGACGGNGGNGGGTQPGTTSTIVNATAGTGGRTVIKVVGSVENHILGR